MKRKKSLQKSVVIVCALFIMLLSILVSAITYFMYMKTLYMRYQKEMLAIISYTESYIDDDDLNECSKTLVESEKYKELRVMMDHFIDYYTDIHYLYIIKVLDPKAAANVMSICSANSTYEKENEPDMVISLGDTPEGYYTEEVAQEILDIQNGDEVVFFKDVTEWGIDYTAAKPLVDSAGNHYGVLCVDISMDDLNNDIHGNTAANITIILFLGAVFIAMLLAWMRINITNPIHKLETSVSEFANTEHDSKNLDSLIFKGPELHSDNEVKSLSDAITKMSVDMRNYVADMLEAEGKVERMKEHVDQMNTLAYEDPLTHVKNKSAYDKMVESLNWDIVNRSARFAIVMVDLNHMKIINDQFGHDKGNEYIVGSCSLLCAIFNHSPVFRIGGDEFVAVLKNRDYENRDELINELKDTFKETAANSDFDPWHRYSAACGMAVYTSEDFDVMSVFKRADEAMYQNKIEMKGLRTN